MLSRWNPIFTSLRELGSRAAFHFISTPCDFCAFLASTCLILAGSGRSDIYKRTERAHVSSDRTLWMQRVFVISGLWPFLRAFNFMCQTPGNLQIKKKMSKGRLWSVRVCQTTLARAALKPSSPWSLKNKLSVWLKKERFYKEVVKAKHTYK